MVISFILKPLLLENVLFSTSIVKDTAVFFASPGTSICRGIHNTLIFHHYVGLDTLSGTTPELMQQMVSSQRITNTYAPPYNKHGPAFHALYSTVADTLGLSDKRKLTFFHATGPDILQMRDLMEIRKIASADPTAAMKCYGKTVPNTLNVEASDAAMRAVSRTYAR